MPVRLALCAVAAVFLAPVAAAQAAIPMGVYGNAGRKPRSPAAYRQHVGPLSR
jgi:hypothetical protein